MTGPRRISVTIDRLAVPAGTDGRALARALKTELRRQLATQTTEAAPARLARLSVPAGRAPATAAAGAVVQAVNGKPRGRS